MRYLKAVCGLAAMAVILSGCGGSPGSSSTSVASSPSGSGSSTPPVSTTGSATLAWSAPTSNTNGTALSDLAGYHIYYGTSTASMTRTVDVTAGTTSYVISNLSAGTWYFGITAYTNSGLESAMSNIGSKTIT